MGNSKCPAFVERGKVKKKIGHPDLPGMAYECAGIKFTARQAPALFDK